MCSESLLPRDDPCPHVEICEQRVGRINERRRPIMLVQKMTRPREAIPEQREEDEHTELEHTAKTTDDASTRGELAAEMRARRRQEERKGGEWECHLVWSLQNQDQMNDPLYQCEHSVFKRT